MFTSLLKWTAALVVLLALFLAVGAYTGVAQAPGTLAMNSGFEEVVSEHSVAQVQDPTPAPEPEEEPPPGPPEQAPPRTGLAEQTGLIIVVLVVVIAIVAIVAIRRPRG
jgi:hypothetical protein